MAEQALKGKKHACPEDLAIRIRIGETIGINRTVLEALHRPMYFRFWWGEDEKMLAVSAADEPDELSVPVPKMFYKPGNGSKIRHYKLMKAMEALTGWPVGSVHPLVGEFIPDNNMVIFRTENAETEATGND